MRKVLQIAGGMNRAGLETFIMNIYRKIDRTNFQFDFMIWQETADYKEEIKSLGGKVYYIPSRRKGIREFHRHLNEFFKTHAKEYDAVHIHCSSLSLIEPLYYAKKYDIPIRIIHSHSSNQGGLHNKVLHLCNKLFVKRLATHYFACSDTAARWMYNFTGIADRALIVNNGVDCEVFKYNEDIRCGLRESFNISHNDIVVGHIGRFSPVKNHEFLISIFEEIIKIEPNSKLVLIGVGPLCDRIKALAAQKKLSHSVYFLGLRDDTHNLLQLMDVFVMPSVYEGLPVTLVEAQAAGLPIVCSDTISKMSKITDYYYCYSLSDSPANWAHNIVQIARSHKRIDTTSVIKEKGFDITLTTDLLSSIYSNR